jgi:two-component system osmolarity sensor histidine kinase EnvZ
LNIQTSELKVETTSLKETRKKLRNYLIGAGITILLMILSIVVLIQRKTIKTQDKEIDNQLKEIAKKNTYLEYAARIIRHDMHSGINTYIPKGLTTLEKRITTEDIQKLKIESSLKMIKEGLQHTQKVYKSVYEFTNLVKQNVVLEKVNENLKVLLQGYLLNTSYSSSVEISDLGELEVNRTLFCNAIDNLIKNGLKYNDSEEKKVKIYLENGFLIVEDNGKGLTQKQLDKIVNNYDKRKIKDIDAPTTGLGLNICLTILQEHGFKLTCEKNEIGTKMIINLK